MEIYKVYLDFINEKSALCSSSTVAYYQLNVKRFVGLDELVDENKIFLASGFNPL